ncbi:MULTISPECIES: hypothetical protein [unclassified Actinomadura]|uniref:hypothetical protein n=1 Tax=unclassified Actinomadura TaxID=2626254 RepID=UPI0011EDE0BD|nr:hypothetical protein [Actinomadura sp. K4S16]
MNLAPLYVTLQTFVLDRIERVRNDSDKGASLIEYAALLVLVGAIVAALYAAGIVGKLDTAVTNALTKIFDGSAT